MRVNSSLEYGYVLRHTLLSRIYLASTWLKKSRSRLNMWKNDGAKRESDHQSHVRMRRQRYLETHPGYFSDSSLEFSGESRMVSLQAIRFRKFNRVVLTVHGDNRGQNPYCMTA